MQHPTLMCDVKMLVYNFDARTGALRMAAGECCDMAACVELFVLVDKDVRSIATFADDMPGTCYIKGPDSWVAVSLP